MLCRSREGGPLGHREASHGSRHQLGVSATIVAFLGTLVV